MDQVSRLKTERGVPALMAVSGRDLPIVEIVQDGPPSLRPALDLIIDTLIRGNIMQAIAVSGPVKLLQGLMAILNAVGTVWIGVITVLISCDILGRVLFNSPIIGVPEIVKVSVVAIVWLQMSHTLKIGGHIRSDVILDRLSPKGRAFIDLIASLLGAFVFGLLVYAGWHNMIEAWRIGEFEGELPVRVPTYPVRTIVLLGAALTSFQFILFGWQSIRKFAGHVKKEGC